MIFKLASFVRFSHRLEYRIECVCEDVNVSAGRQAIMMWRLRLIDGWDECSWTQIMPYCCYDFYTGHCSHSAVCNVLRFHWHIRQVICFSSSYCDFVFLPVMVTKCCSLRRRPSTPETRPKTLALPAEMRSRRDVSMFEMKPRQDVVNSRDLTETLNYRYTLYSLQ